MRYSNVILAERKKMRDAVRQNLPARPAKRSGGTLPILPGNTLFEVKMNVARRSLTIAAVAERRRKRDLAASDARMAAVESSCRAAAKAALKRKPLGPARFNRLVTGIRTLALRGA